MSRGGPPDLPAGLPRLAPAGWNRAATRYIDPPLLAWDGAQGAVQYEIGWRAGDAVTGRETADAPTATFTPVWDRVPVGPVDWWAVARDGAGRPVGWTGERRFWRVPDFDGREEPALDLAGAARRTIRFLLDQPRADGTGWPRYLTHSWHGGSAGEQELAYPALHYPSFSSLFLAALQDPGCDGWRVEIEGALETLAAAILVERTPAGGVAPRMPVSTRQAAGVRRDWAEGGAISLFRAARMGEAILELAAWKPDARLDEYAAHIAATLARLQRPDGSWPYRIDARTGAVVDEYTSAGISTVPFFVRLMGMTGTPAYRDTVDRAVRWTLEQPCTTHRWQGMYEDVAPAAPFANLENWDALDAVAWLAGPGRPVPGALEAAVRLNRWVEDQFVVFGAVPGLERTAIHPPGVIEQFICAYPMEVHTAHWIEGLRALHEATGDSAYAIKACRAANAIVRAQGPDGRLSTWGRDARSGEPFSQEGDWYGCNAYAARVLLGLAAAS